MYELISKRKEKKLMEWPLAAGIGVSFLVIAIIVSLIIWSGWYQRRYWRFVSDFSESTVYAYENDSLQADVNGVKIKMYRDNAYALYTVITDNGPGKLGTAPQEHPAAVLHFGDGSSLELWSVELVNSSTDREYGLFLRYTDVTGKRYSYDTDQISLEKVLKYCSLENNQEWE